MSSGSPPPPLEHLEPTSKTASVSANVHHSTPTTDPRDASRVSSKSRPARVNYDPEQSDQVSDKATLALIRRVLVTDNVPDVQETSGAIEELLPSLTSSNDVDIQLYAFIAIVVKDCISSWYSKFTPDHTFVEEVVQIIAHCSRSLEQRLRRLDVGQLFLDEIPAVLQNHIEAYRIAHGAFGQDSYRPRPTQIYHTLNLHPALVPCADLNDEQSLQEQSDHEVIYRQLLVQSTLAVLLPTEDLANTCLTTLVGDIIADLILGQAVAGKLSQGWFIHGNITKIVGIFKARIEQSATTDASSRADARSRLEKFGLLTPADQDTTRHSPNSYQSRLSTYFWQLLQYAVFVVLFLRSVLVGLSESRQSPPRFSMQSGSSTPIASTSNMSPTSAHPTSLRRAGATTSAMLSYRIFPAVSTLLRLPIRMPWLAGSAALLQHFLLYGPGQIGATNSLLDKFLYHLSQTRVLPASLLPQLLLNARISLFPSNSLGDPTPSAPTVEEQLAIRKQAAESILSLAPPLVAKTFFASPNQQEWIAEVEDMLDIFGQTELNKYWIYGVLELVLIRVMPELAEKSWSELLAERGVVLDLHEKQPATREDLGRTAAPNQEKVITARKKSSVAKVPPQASNGVQKAKKIILTGK